MRPTTLSEASQDYATAYATHYSTCDLQMAFRLYKRLIATHPSSDEAKYSRIQIHNIVNSVISKQEVWNLQVELLDRHFANLDKDEAKHEPNTSGDAATG